MKRIAEVSGEFIVYEEDGHTEIKSDEKVGFCFMIEVGKNPMKDVFKYLETVEKVKYMREIRGMRIIITEVDE